MLHSNQISTRGRLGKSTQLITSGFIPILRKFDSYAVNIATRGRLASGSRLASAGFVAAQIYIEEIVPVPPMPPTVSVPTGGSVGSWRREYKKRKETKTIKVTAFVNGQKFEHFQEVGILAKVSIENVKIEEDEHGQISIVVENLSI